MQDRVDPPMENTRLGSLLRRLLIYLTAIFLGILWAVPLVEMVGLLPKSKKGDLDIEAVAFYGIGAGVLIGLLSLVLLLVANWLCDEYVRSCRERIEKPPTSIAITFVLSGTACLLASLFCGTLCLWFMSNAAYLMLRIRQELELGRETVRMPLVMQVVCMFTFVAGLYMIRLGIAVASAGTSNVISTPAQATLEQHTPEVVKSEHLKGY